MDFIKQARKQVKIACSSTGCASTDPVKEEAFYALYWFVGSLKKKWKLCKNFTRFRKILKSIKQIPLFFLFP